MNHNTSENSDLLVGTTRSKIKMAYQMTKYRWIEFDETLGKSPIRKALEVQAVGKLNALLLPTTTVIRLACVGKVSNLCSRFDQRHQCLGRGGVQGIPVVLYRYLNEQAIRARVPDQRGAHVCVVGDESSALPTRILAQER